MSLRANKVALGNFSSTLKPKSNKKSRVKEITRDTLTLAIFSIAMIKTPPMWLLSNEIAKQFNASASAVPPATKEQENLPQDIKTFLWSNDGLQQNEVIQNKDNCQIMANIIASTFTEEGRRRLESMIEVTDYNLDYRNFYINFNVNINGKKIPVSYDDLINESPSLDHWGYNYPQAPYVLAYAVEKELEENYLPNPDGYTAESTSTFFTNKDYSTLMVPVMSDASLIEVLKQAPNEIVCVGSYPKLSDTERAVINILKMEPEIIEHPSKNDVVLNHEFAVKNYKYENGEHLITLVAYHNQEVTLTLEEFRKNILTITAPTKSFNIIDSRAMWTYGISIMLIIALNKAWKEKTRI